MPFRFQSTWSVPFFLLLAVSLLPDVHAAQPTRRSIDGYYPGPELIMDNDFFTINGYAPVYFTNAQVAFMAGRHFTDPKHGHSEYTVSQGGVGQNVLILDSRDDLCNQKSHYIDQRGNAHFTIDPRGIKSDKWYFGTAQGGKFRFDRNVLNKGGKIVNEFTEKVVATLSVEDRKEPWLINLFKSPTAFVMRTDSSVPLYDLAALMILVQMRVDLCGL